MSRWPGVLFAVFALSASAQPLQFGALTPLTNTRYGPVDRLSIMTTNGTDAFVVTASGHVKIAKVVEGLPRAGRVVCPNVSDVDIVWTGTHFLLAATSYQDGAIKGLLLDRNGEPLGEPFNILASGSRPRLAWNGTTVLMLFSPQRSSYPTTSVHAMSLSATGQPAMTSEEVASAVTDYAVSSNGIGFAAITASRTALQFVTWDGTGTIRSRESRDGLEEDDRDVAIASNESEYLTVWLTAKGTISASTLIPGGTMSEPVTLGETGLEETGAPSLLWDGSRYSLTYRAGEEDTFIRVIQLDAMSVSHAYSADARRFTNTSAIAVNGRSYVAWMARDGTVRLRDSSDSSAESTTTGYGAASQEILTTATSASGTLFVWREWIGGQYTLHAGIRARSGEWLERPILENADGNTPAVAASDGEEFMVIASDRNGRVALCLRSNGRLRRAPVRFNSDLYPTAIAWNGQTYVVAGTRRPAYYYYYYSTLFVVTVDRSGALGAPVYVPSARYYLASYTPHLATNGATVMLAWIEPEPIYCGQGYCWPEEPGFILARQLLGPSLEFLDSPIVTAGLAPDMSVSGLFWTGAEYVLGWMKKSRLHVARYSENGAPVAAEVTLPREAGWMSGMTPSGAILLTHMADDYRAMAVTTFDRGTVAPAAVLHLPAHGLSRVVALFDDRIAWVGGISQPDMPHHGAYRLMMTIGAASAPPRASAPPKLAARAQGETVMLEWIAPGGAVNGYRIEYRIGEGSWNELDRWLDAATSQTDIRLPAGVTRAEFRMRAWNDGGTSPYSDAVAVGVPRRRSVR